MLYKVPFYGEWVAHTDEDLGLLKNDGMSDYVAAYKDRAFSMKENPLKFFLPHGVPWRGSPKDVADGRFTIQESQYDKSFGNDGIAFQNDWVSDGVVVLAPNQCGKSFGLAAWTGYRILPTHESWPCYTENGLVYHEWDGPKKWIIASYSWDNVATIWDRVREVFPKEELMEYAPGGKRNLTFGDGRPKQLELLCGSSLRFLCYTQLQMHWEGFECDGGSFDEQVPREKFVGWMRGTTTRGDYTPFGMALTGHVLEDRPDTGAAGWIKRDLWDNNNRMGKDIRFYHLDIPHTPDEIISKKKKRSLYDTWVNPAMARSRKDERAAIARYWGGWEEGSGMVFDSDVWQRDIHVIPAPWGENDVPRDLTKWRSIDYGSAKGVNVCSWFAMGAGDIGYCYRVLYERGLEIADFVKMIVELSKNERKLIGEQRDASSGNVYQYYEERCVGEEYWGGSILDPRSAGQSQQGQTLEEIFYRYGLRDIRPGCGQRDDIQIPRLKDMMRIDWDKAHPVTGKKGCPRLFFIEGETIAAQREIEGARKPEEGQIGFIHKRDPQHWIDTAKYWTSDGPRFMGDYYVQEATEEEGGGNGNRFTSY